MTLPYTCLLLYIYIQFIFIIHLNCNYAEKIGIFAVFSKRVKNFLIKKLNDITILRPIKNLL